MRKIYKLYIGIMLSVIAVACSDKLDSDKYFKDRRSLVERGLLLRNASR